MGRRHAMRDDVSADRRIVKRLIDGPVVAIAVVADGKYSREHKAYTSWDTRDPTRGPSDMVDVDHMAHLFPGPHAYSRCEHGGFNFHAVTVELLVGKKLRRQNRRLAVPGIIDLPQSYDGILVGRTRRGPACTLGENAKRAETPQQNRTECNFQFFHLIFFFDLFLAVFDLSP